MRTCFNAQEEIYQASMDGTLWVTMPAWERAVEKAAELEKTLFRFFETNLSKAGYKYQQAVEMCFAAGREGVPKKDFTTVFQDPAVRKAIIEMFRETGDVTLVQRDHVGRKGPVPMFWVHRDHLPDGQ
jgi:hypothetical protein